MDGRLDRRRLALVVARFQSPFDGERLAAIEAATRLLDAGGATWADLIEGPQQAHDDDTDERRETSHHRQIKAILREAGDLLTGWESEFLHGCLRFRALSPKQLEALAEIQRKVEAMKGADA